MRQLLSQIPWIAGSVIVGGVVIASGGSALQSGVAGIATGASGFATSVIVTQSSGNGRKVEDKEWVSSVVKEALKDEFRGIEKRQNPRYDSSSLRMALLIDADNAFASDFEKVLKEAAKHGDIVLRRAYGGGHLFREDGYWGHDILRKYAIKPILQIPYTRRKNATDIALVIDAMDLIESGKYDGLCIISSDSDFTGLAVRAREEGLKVFGFGQVKTPLAFRQACDEFIFIYKDENEASTGELQVTDAVDDSHLNDGDEGQDIDQILDIDFLQTAINSLEGDNDGWINGSQFGSYLRRLRSDFSYRAYGYSSLGDLVRAREDIFETVRRENTNGGSSLYIRSRNRNYVALDDLLRQAYQNSEKINDWVKEEELEKSLNVIKIDFSFSDYGYNRLADLVKAKPENFLVRKRDDLSYEIRLLSGFR